MKPTQKEQVLSMLKSAGSGATADYGYCQCGCGRKTRIATENRANRGYRRGEPMPYALGHSGGRRGRFKDPFGRLIKAIDFTQSDCWVWQSLAGNGYGYFNLEGRQCLAHRAVYELLVGPIPEQLELDHLCRNPACVNPAHLEPVTHQENIKRGAAGQRTHCPHGHPYDEENTYFRPGSGRRVCRACNREGSRRRKSA